MVLIVSMLLTIGATYIFHQNEESKVLARFQSETARFKNRLDGKITTYTALLKAGRGFVESENSLSREVFARFVNNLEIEKNYKDVQGIGYAKRVLSSERQSLIKKMRAGDYPNFGIFPETEKNDYQAVIYAEPSETNSSLLGFDMSSEPSCAAAMQQARDTGEPTATGNITLRNTGEPSPKNEFLIYIPVYKGSKNPVSVEDRQRLLSGFIFSLVNTDNFLNDTQKSLEIDDIAVNIYQTETQPKTLLTQTSYEPEEITDKLTATNEMSVAGRKWLVQYEGLPSFESQSSVGWTPIIFSTGVAFSLLIFGVTYLESRARAKAENILGELRESEREKAFLLEGEQKARQFAEESNRAKDEFIAIVSHELRTPLNSIAGWTKILQSENLPESTRIKALQTIDRNLRLQTRIVEELLDFSQIFSNKKNLSKRQVDLSKIFDEAFFETKESVEAQGISLIKVNNFGDRKIFGDSRKLKNVLINLLSNAVKFTPKGGEIIAELKRDGRMAEINIRDNGQGISAQFLPHIFEHFKQVDSSITRRHGGLGLGLAVSRHIIELHGGTIAAASEGEGKGTVFTLRLPL